MDAVMVKPVSLERLAQVLASYAPSLSFDMDTLRHLTRANEEQLQRMLAELWKNLDQEQATVQQAVDVQDWKAMGAAMHRLKGAACLVDAVELAKACAAFDADVRIESVAALAQRWPALQRCLIRLRADILSQLKEPVI
jgi:two-component system sensor histidine kinase EvgS